MSERFSFSPPRRTGVLLHGALIILFTAVGVLGILYAAQASVVPLFLLYLLPSLIALGLVFWLSFRLFSLIRSEYTLERNGVSLRWGFRVEEIPMFDVRWVRLADEVSYRLPLPPLRLPGAIVGRRRSAALGEIEYIAATTRGLVLIATSKRIYAISPSDLETCISAYRYLAELGSLEPIEAHSLYPVGLFVRVWSTQWVRFLLLAGAFLGLILFVGVSLVVIFRPEVSLGFDATGQPLPPLPAVRLFLFPVLNSMAFFVDLFLGLIVFRQEATRPLAYLLWCAGLLTSLLFLVAMFFVLRG
ncbi:MAG: PH domain-containing protein [Chloroflexota bacterium]